MAGTSMVGPGRMPSRKTWLVGGGLLVLVLGGYWYLNGRDPGRGRKARQRRAGARGGGPSSATWRWWSAAWAPSSPIPWFSSAPGCRAPWSAPISRKATSSRRGDLLFVIDPRPFQAAVAQAEAIYAPRPGADEERAARPATVMRRCSQQGAISAAAEHTSQTNADVMSATVAADKAALDMARLNLGRHPDPLAGGRQDRADPGAAGQHDFQFQWRHLGAGDDRRSAAH